MVLQLNLKRAIMLKKIVFSCTLFISYINSYAYEIEVKEGWNLLGAVEQVEDMSIFDGHNFTTKDKPEPESVWTYSNDKWNRYSSYNKDINFKDITSIKKGEGFWFYSLEARAIKVKKINFTLEESNITLLSNFKEFNSSKNFELIRDQERFSKLYQMSSADVLTINFETNTILALIAGEQNSGYRSVISAIKKYRGYSVLDINTTIRSSQCNESNTKLSPATFIKIPKINPLKKHIILHENISVEACKPEQIVEEKELLYTDISHIYEIDQSSITYKKYQVIQTAKEFDSLSLNASLIEKPQVDMENSTVIALYLGTQSTIANDLNVKSIKEYKDYVEVTIESSIYKYGCAVPTMLGSPFKIISLQKTEKPIIFNEFMNEKHCN